MILIRTEQPGSHSPQPQRRNLAVLSGGFRPFFLASSLWAAVAMVLWTGMLTGSVMLPTAFDPLAWHAHEFLYGYVMAVIGGFMLTAVPNWTKRPPMMGTALAVLITLWMAGRVAVAISEMLPWQAVAVADLSLGVALSLVLCAVLIKARNWRNLPVIGLIAVFVISNAVFHLEASTFGHAHDGLGMRLGLATLLMLIALIGGRIIPSFSRNWLSARGASSLPAAFGRGDAFVLALTALALAGFVTAPHAKSLGWLMLSVAAAHVWRLSRWCGWQVRREPLLWVLHLAYLALGLGFAAEAAVIWGFMEHGASRHIWFAGAIGLMTLAVMARATLGHTGRALKAGGLTTGIFLAMGGSTIARVAAGGAWEPMPLLMASSGLWTAAFAGFLVTFGPMLLQSRQAKSSSLPA